MRHPKWANCFMFFLLFFNLLIVFVFSFLSDNWKTLADWSLLPPFLVASQFISFIVPLLLFMVFLKLVCRSDSEPLFKTSFPLKKLSALNVLFIIGISVCMQPAMMTLSALSSILFPNPVTEIMTDLNALPLPGAIAIIALTPAICEEAVFRGFILSRYSKVRISAAALVNGLFFGMMHLSEQQFLYAFAMGIVFSYMVYYTRSIWASVLAHFTINAVQYTIGYAASSMADAAEIAAANITAADLLGAALTLFIIAILFLPPLALLFYAFIAHNKKRNLESDLLTVIPDSLPLEPQSEFTEPKQPSPIDVFFCGSVVLYVSIMLVF